MELSGPDHHLLELAQILAALNPQFSQENGFLSREIVFLFQEKVSHRDLRFVETAQQLAALNPQFSQEKGLLIWARTYWRWREGDEKQDPSEELQLQTSLPNACACD